ncbi:MAG: hypothetical protein E6J13_12975 [Chloroflexi bacterium]|nr:MAG: hypothetical protein E6J13_12975 [Chloroflexota bacterium]
MTVLEGGGGTIGDGSRDSARRAPYLLEDRVHGCDLLFAPDLPDEAYTRLFEVDLEREFGGVTAAWDKEQRDWRAVGPRQSRQSNGDQLIERCAPRPDLEPRRRLFP